MRNALTALVLVSISLLAPLSTHARQFTVQQGGRNYVAHTRRAPVIIHRVLPPYRGEHIYYQPGR
jgi:hypothetical protein